MKGIILCFSVIWLTACSLAPTYNHPAIRIPATYREAGQWQAVRPSFSVSKGDTWWRIYRDPILDNLETRVTDANQTIEIAYARFQEACALAAVARADLFPTVSANAGYSHIRNSLNTALNRPSSYNDFVVGPNLSYEIDVWGRVRNTVLAARATALASAADLAVVNLTMHAELASDYFSLRADDEAQHILDEAVKAYTLAYQLTARRHKGGVSPAADVDQAYSQLESAKTQAADKRLQRAQLEHAIATLIGVVPANFHLAPRLTPLHIVSIAPIIPSGLLQRRPDVAAKALLVEAANARIGVARAAYFPDFNLLGGIGFESTSGNNLFAMPSLFWSLGPTVALTLIDGGRINAFVRLANAKYFETVATYRLTALTAFQEVEDSLVAIHRLDQERMTQDAATAAANRAEQQANYRYKGGLINYLDVVYEQNIALQAALIDVDVKTRRQLASVQLIKALGGGWDPEFN